MEKYNKLSELFFMQFHFDEFNGMPVESILLKKYLGAIEEMSNIIKERKN